MAEVSIPDVVAADEDAPRVRARRSFARLTLEVALITTGVFLALLGDEWRENREHRALAQTSLRRFQTEIRANRSALAGVIDYHAATRKSLAAFFESNRPRTPEAFDVQFRGLGPVFFEQTAWDLALATQSLAYIDADLAFALSRAYTVQRGYAAQQNAIVQSTIYGRSWNQDFEGYWRSVLAYYGDLQVLDPTLLRAYDDVLPRIDRVLGESAAEPTRSR
jgi:hypothetical protein